MDPTELSHRLDVHAPEEGNGAGYVMVGGQPYEPHEVRDFAARLIELADFADSHPSARDEADFPMGKLVELLAAHDVASEVNMTGGNVATIYAYIDGERAASDPTNPYVSIGPGTFNWAHPSLSEATLYELSATQHPEGYDSEGETVMFDETQTLEEVAVVITSLVRGMA